MTDSCSHKELIVTVTALAAKFDAHKELMDERDERYKQRSEFQDEAVNTAMAASKEAILKAEAATDKRLESLNEIKAMSLDQASTFARKTEVNLITDALGKRLDGVEDGMNRRVSTGAGMEKAWGYVIGVLGVLTALAIAWLRR